MSKSTESFLATSDVVKTPAYVVDLSRLRDNAAVLEKAQRASGATILLALKGFSMWGVFDVLKPILGGCAVSSPWEAELAHKHFGRQVHGYAPAYKPEDIDEMSRFCDHIVFNSLSQAAALHGRCGSMEIGLRINPQHSEVKTALYDPCAPKSRLGVTKEALRDGLPGYITGLHMHTLCELGADALERTTEVLERDFAQSLAAIRWLNLGGGHHITRPGYDIEQLAATVGRLRERYDVEIFLEPGEAAALNTGWLVAEVVDIVHNDMDIAILDTSATAHMPDVLEMPYRPHIPGADQPGVLAHTYRLGGLTCLAGDVIGDYSFAQPLAVGQRLLFADMAHYTMVKNTTFNGVKLPDIATYDPENGDYTILRSFDYADYETRLS